MNKTPAKRLRRLKRNGHKVAFRLRKYMSDWLMVLKILEKLFIKLGEKFWTRTRSKYTDLGEFETIYGYTKL